VHAQIGQRAVGAAGSATPRRRSPGAYSTRGMRKASVPWAPHDSHHPGSATLRGASERLGSVLGTQSAHRRTTRWAATNAATRAAR
jgi:hypothetical protein